jgi:hypothetical protein
MVFYNRVRTRQRERGRETEAIMENKNKIIASHLLMIPDVQNAILSRTSKDR